MMFHCLSGVGELGYKHSLGWQIQSDKPFASIEIINSKIESIQNNFFEANCNQNQSGNNGCNAFITSFSINDILGSVFNALFKIDNFISLSRLIFSISTRAP